MKYYSLSNVPNQSFNTNLNGHNFSFTFRSFRKLTYVDVYIDGTIAHAGSLAVPNRSLFKESVNNTAGGIFKFICNSDDYPYYDNFDDINIRFAFVPFGE